MRLTKRVIDQLEPQGSDKDHYDESLKGFGLRVRPSGRKTYFVMTRIKGRLKRYTIGPSDRMTVEEARLKARALLGDLAGGIDPLSDRDRASGGITLATLGERFLAEYVRVRLKPSTSGEYSRAVRLFVTPKLGNTLVSELSRPEVAAFHHELRVTPYQANRTLGVLSVMMAQAELWGLRGEGTNPCRGVRKFRESKRERFLSYDEIERLGAALDEETPLAPSAVHCIRLLLLTGCRLGEIQKLEWSFVDFDRMMINLPDSKTGKKAVYLGDAAVRALRAIQRQLDNPFVIVGEIRGRHLTDMQRPWRRIRARAGLPDVRIHDLRHTFASSALGLGEGLSTIGKLLGHTQTQTTARYAHIAEAAARNAAGRVAASIAESLTARRAQNL